MEWASEFGVCDSNAFSSCDKLPNNNLLIYTRSCIILERTELIHANPNGIYAFHNELRSATISHHLICEDRRNVDHVCMARHRVTHASVKYIQLQCIQVGFDTFISRHRRYNRRYPRNFDSFVDIFDAHISLNIKFDLAVRFDGI